MCEERPAVWCVRHGPSLLHGDDELPPLIDESFEIHTADITKNPTSIVIVDNSTASLMPMQALTDTDKLMYLVYRQEMIAITAVVDDYDYQYCKCIHEAMNPAGGSPTMTYSLDEHNRTREINKLVKRRRLNEAFKLAIGSVFKFFMQSIFHLTENFAALHQDGSD